MTPITLLANPRAGAGRGGDVLPRVERALRALGAEVNVVRTTAPGDATHRTREALRAGTPGVIVVGGDGTLSEATDGFFEGGVSLRPDAWLAPISSGTGGDFRRSLGAEDVGRGRVEELVARMWRAAVRTIDVGHLRFVGHDGAERDRMFLNIASFGVGGLVDQLVNDAPKWMGGTAAFFGGTLRALARYRPQRVRLSLDGVALPEARITNIAVCNGRYFGGGMHVAPGAQLDDGLFDVVTMHALGTRAALALAPHLYRGTHLGRAGVDHARARVVVAESIEPGEHVLLDVDGEAPGRLPARFEIKAAALCLRG